MLEIPVSLPSEILQKFTVENNTFKEVVKPDPKDKIEVEVGDSKQADFKPQFKLMRWDNEVNFSIRAEEHPDATVETVGEVIKYKAKDYEVHMYDKPEASEEGGFEFEWKLPKRPKTNILSATIQTKELNFYYQPALTQQEIDGGAVRPENVVGSYAVYHKTKGGMNDSAGMEYKVGKAFHIYRPKVTDAKGDSIWGELHIDEESGLLTVTIDEKWLDTAVYPVIVDPTFGYTTSGASGGQYVQNDMEGTLNTAPGNGTVDSITTRISYVPVNVENLKAILANSSLNIVTNGISNSNTSTTSASNRTFTFATPPTITSGQNYWLMMIPDGSCNYRYDSGNTLGNHKVDLSNSYTTPTNPTDASSLYDPARYITIYATYTESEGTATNDSRSAKITGKLTANDSRSAKITGIAGDVYTRKYNATLPTNDDPLTTQYTEQDYTDVGTDDTDYVEMNASATGYMIHQFEKFNTNENNTDTINVSIVARSTLAPSSATVYLQIYNRNSASWENLDSEASANANTDFTLSGSQSTNLSYYYDANYIVALRVYQQVT